MNSSNRFNSKAFKLDHKFPSPTGVKYYELGDVKVEIIIDDGFRPQQGLSIMNSLLEWLILLEVSNGFRPQQGLSIMN